MENFEFDVQDIDPVVDGLGTPLGDDDPGHSPGGGRSPTHPVTITETDFVYQDVPIDYGQFAGLAAQMKFPKKENKLVPKRIRQRYRPDQLKRPVRPTSLSPGRPEKRPIQVEFVQPNDVIPRHLRRMYQILKPDRPRPEPNLVYVPPMAQFAQRDEKEEVNRILQDPVPPGFRGAIISYIFSLLSNIIPDLTGREPETEPVPTPDVFDYSILDQPYLELKEYLDREYIVWRLNQAHPQVQKQLKREEADMRRAAEEHVRKMNPDWLFQQYQNRLQWRQDSGQRETNLRELVRQIQAFPRLSPIDQTIIDQLERLASPELAGEDLRRELKLAVQIALQRHPPSVESTFKSIRTNRYQNLMNQARQDLSLKKEFLDQYQSELENRWNEYDRQYRQALERARDRKKRREAKEESQRRARDRARKSERRRRQRQIQTPELSQRGLDTIHALEELDAQVWESGMTVSAYGNKMMYPFTLLMDPFRAETRFYQAKLATGAYQIRNLLTEGNLGSLFPEWMGAVLDDPEAIDARIRAYARAVSRATVYAVRKWNSQRDPTARRRQIPYPTLIPLSSLKVIDLRRACARDTGSGRGRSNTPISEEELVICHDPKSGFTCHSESELIWFIANQIDNPYTQAPFAPDLVARIKKRYPERLAQAVEEDSEDWQKWALGREDEVSEEYQSWALFGEEEASFEAPSGAPSGLTPSGAPSGWKSASRPPSRIHSLRVASGQKPSGRKWRSEGDTVARVDLRPDLSDQQLLKELKRLKRKTNAKQFGQVWARRRLARKYRFTDRQWQIVWGLFQDQQVVRRRVGDDRILEEALRVMNKHPKMGRRDLLARIRLKYILQPGQWNRLKEKIPKPSEDPKSPKPSGPKPSDQRSDDWYVRQAEQMIQAEPNRWTLKSLKRHWKEEYHMGREQWKRVKARLKAMIDQTQLLAGHSILIESDRPTSSR